MKKLVATCLLWLVFVSLVTPIRASVTVEGLIGQDIYVVYTIEGMNSTLYDEILEQRIFNVSTIPQAIEKYLEGHNLENARVDYDPTREIFNNSTRSIQVEFYLSGSDIIDITFNPTAMTKTYNAETEWRKVQINLTHDFSLNFAQYFQNPVSEWRITNFTMDGEVHPTYVYNYTDPIAFDPLCRFVLPTEATNVHAIKDTIIFELPLPPEDNLISSPLLVLGVLIIVNIALFAYRKIRK